MSRLDGLSALFVYGDKPKRYQHTLKVAFLNGGVNGIQSLDELTDLFNENINQVPMLRWKLAKTPIGLNHPVWIEAQDFDIRYHVRRVRCPAPGDSRAFCELISQLYAYPMDKSCPLWLSWVIDGLADGQTAIVTMLHHAYTDGAGASRMLERMLAPEQQGSYPVARLKYKGNPGKVELLVRGVVDLPGLYIRELPQVVRGALSLRRVKRELIRSIGSLPPGPADAPDSPFNTTLSHRRSFVYKVYPLSEIKSLSKQLGVTINDLFVAICAGAYRRFLLDTGFDPAVGPLVCSIPINERPAPEQDDLIGNKVRNSYMHMPIQLSEPEQRLQATVASAKTMKAYVKRTRGIGMTKILNLMPPAFTHVMDWIVDLKKGRLSLGGNMVLSNVAGPTKPLQVAGGTIVNWLSIGQVSAGLALNTTVWSYEKYFNVCIMADAHVVPDGWVLIDYITEEIEVFQRMADSSTNAAAPST